MRAVLMSLIGAGLLACVTPAEAGIGIDIDIHSGSRPYPIDRGPVYERVWVPPVKQLVTQNVWHEAVTADRVDRLWVPDRIETRDVEGRDYRGRRVIIRQAVVVDPAHWEDRHTPVVVRAGYFAPETTEVIVSPGYWQTVPLRTAPPVMVEDRFIIHYDGRGDERRHDYHDRGRDDRHYDRH